MLGQLFSTNFLLHGIQETETWKGVPDAELNTFIVQLKAHYASFTADSAPNESQTEDELIEPVIDLRGWNDAWISQVSLSQSGREQDIKTHGTFRTCDLIMGYLVPVRTGTLNHESLS